jgi:hypothetical protein
MSNHLYVLVVSLGVGLIVGSLALLFADVVREAQERRRSRN